MRSAPTETTTGHNQFWGGAGDDTIYVAGSDGTVHEEDGSGSDYIAGDATTTVDYSAGTTALLGPDHISDFTVVSADGSVDTLAGITRLVGSRGDDLLVGLNVIDGGGGDDTISGSLFRDTLKGGSGKDLLSYAASGDGVKVDLARGIAGPEKDRVSGFERVVGSQIDDVIIGNSASNTLEGGGGDDRLEGGGRADRFVFAGDFGRDTVVDFAHASDRIDLRGLRAINDGVALAFDQLRLSLKAGDTRIELDLDADGKADQLDLDGDGTVDKVRIALLHVDAAAIDAGDFAF